MRFPQIEDWEWVGVSTSRELEDAGTDSFSAEWIRRAYSWFWNRLPKSERSNFKPPFEGISPLRPPLKYVPFPASIGSDSPTKDSGIIGFVAVDSNGSPHTEIETGENDGTKVFAHKAASYVYKIFQKFDSSVGFPRVEIEAQNAEGGSTALSSMIAALCRILKIEVPDSIIATGCFETRDDGESLLRPAATGTFAQKLIAAARFGFQKFFCVEGQKGQFNSKDLVPAELFEALKSDGLIYTDSELEIIEVSKNPTHALFEIGCELPTSTGKELAEFLAELSHQNLWYRPDFVRLLETLGKSESRLVSHLALEMRSRVELHRGNTQEAQKFRLQIPQLRASDFPFGPLGSYLKYEETASRVILKIDLGIWNDDDQDVQLLHRILRRQREYIEDRIADIEDIRIAMVAANTDARRLFFLGRLYRNENLLCRAWDELTAFQEYWPEIFEYTEKQNLKDETLSRQLNQCLECQEDYWNLTGKLFPTPFLPENFELPDDANAYVLTAWLRWVFVYRKYSEVSFDRFFKRADELYKNYANYPNFQPYEKFLIFKLGNAEEKAHAREQLARANHLEEPEGILSVLAMRTSWILRNEILLQRSWNAVPWSLRGLANELMKKPEEIVVRCPY